MTLNGGAAKHSVVLPSDNGVSIAQLWNSVKCSAAVKPIAKGFTIPGQRQPEGSRTIPVVFR